MNVKSLGSFWKSVLFPLWMASFFLVVAAEEGGAPPNPQPTEFDSIRRRSGIDSILRTPYIHGSPYHWESPTATVVQFARLRLEMREKFDPIRERLRELDDRIRELVNGTAKRLLEKAEEMKEMIEDEAEEMKNSFLDLEEESADKFRDAARKSEAAEGNMKLLDRTVKKNKEFAAKENKAFGDIFAADMGAITALLGTMQGEMDTVEAKVKDPEKTRKDDCRKFMDKIQKEEGYFG